MESVTSAKSRAGRVAVNPDCTVGGRPDVFVSCVGKHRLFRNVDGKRFEDVTAAAGVGGPGPDVPTTSRALVCAFLHAGNAEAQVSQLLRLARQAREERRGGERDARHVALEDPDEVVVGTRADARGRVCTSRLEAPLAT